MMARSMHMPAYFFLHGGPGLSTLPERRWMEAPPTMCWWDQPRVQAGTPQAFLHLCEATRAAFREQARQSPVVVAAASFAVHLALDLIEQYPDDIARLVLISPTFDPRAAYLRLAQRVSELHRNDDLAGKIRVVQSRPTDSAAFWEMVATVLATPDFLDLYWGPGAPERREQFKAMLGDGDVFDFATFHAVLDDFLFGSGRRSNTQRVFGKPVTIVVGAHDMLCHPIANDSDLLHRLPQAEIRTVQAGHFLHLETACFENDNDIVGRMTSSPLLSRRIHANEVN